MRLGSMCHIKSKKNALNTYVVLYPDIEEVLEERCTQNNWLPSILTVPSSVNYLSTKHKATVRRTDEPFVLLKEFQDGHGSLYYQCLYNDSFGWIIGSKKNFDIIEEDNKKSI